jgi:hypothetical protein
MFDKGFILDAVVKANGRCFYYATAIALSDLTGKKVEPGDVKRNVMKKLKESLLNPDLRFNQHALSFMDVEDYGDNNSRFAKWFRNEIYDVPRILNPMEADESYHRRVMQCILQLEDKLHLRCFFFLVEYFSYEVFEFACAFVMRPFLDAYPDVGISAWDIKHTCLSSGFTEPALQTPESELRKKVAWAIENGENVLQAPSMKKRRAPLDYTTLERLSREFQTF